MKRRCTHKWSRGQIHYWTSKTLFFISFAFRLNSSRFLKQTNSKNCSTEIKPSSKANCLKNVCLEKLLILVVIEKLSACLPALTICDISTKFIIQIMWASVCTLHWFCFIEARSCIKFAIKKIFKQGFFTFCYKNQAKKNWKQRKARKKCWHS